jgi:Flp pilus assembly protein TadG
MGIVRALRGFNRNADDAGASALEFALVAPVLLLLVLGLIEFGFMFQVQLALTHGAREGARIAAVGQFDPAVIISRSYPVTPAIATAPNPPSAATSGQPITVTLTYDYDWQVLPIPGTVTLEGRATMRRE